MWWLVSIALIAGASWLLSRQLRGLSWQVLADAWGSTPLLAILASLACVALSFACLGAYEVFAARSTLGHRVPTGRVFSVGLVGHALSNTLGFPLLTGTAFRARAYKRFGVGAGELARLLVRVSACVAMGVAACLVCAAMSHARWRVPAVAAIAAIVVGWILVRSRSARCDPALQRWAAVGEGLGTMLPIAALEMLGMMTALWLLLPASVQLQPSAFVLLFVAAMLAGLVAHAPGGLGVFEAVMLTAAPAGHAAELLAALLLYRALYNLAPFTLALVAAPFLVGPARLLPNRARVTQFDGG